MTGVKIKAEVSLETLQCPSCAITFAVPEVWQREKRRSHETFFCPNGHNQYYSQETFEQKQIRELREALDKQTRRANAAAQNEMIEREARKAVEKKMARVSAGVCPCCNRSFQNLSRHINTKHPDFVDKGKRTRAVKP